MTITWPMITVLGSLLLCIAMCAFAWRLWWTEGRWLDSRRANVFFLTVITAAMLFVAWLAAKVWGLL